MMNNLKQFMQNPMQYILKSRLNIPQNFQGDTNDMIQYLLNSGQLTQEQYNRVNQKARELQNNQQFMQMFIGQNKIQ